MPINFVMQGKCLFSDISRPDVVTTLAPSFLIGSSSFLQATSNSIISRKGTVIQQDRTRDL